MNRSVIAAALLVAAPLIAIIPTSPAAAAEASCVALSSAPETDIHSHVEDLRNGSGTLVGRVHVYRSDGYVIGGVTLYDYCVQTQLTSAGYGSYTTRPAKSTVYTYKADGSQAAADSGDCTITAAQSCSVLIKGQRAMRKAYGRVTVSTGSSYSDLYEYAPPASFPNSGAPCASLADSTLQPFTTVYRSVNLVTDGGLPVGKATLYRSAGYWNAGRTVYDYCAVTSTKVEAYGNYANNVSSVAAEVNMTTEIAPDMLAYSENTCDLAAVTVECAVAKKGQTEYPDQFGGWVRVGGTNVAEQVYFNLGDSSAAQSGDITSSNDN